MKCLTPARDRAVKQVAGGAGVVAVVLQRIADGLGNDRVCGEMQNGGDSVSGKQSGHQIPVAGIAGYQQCHPVLPSESRWRGHPARRPARRPRTAA